MKEALKLIFAFAKERKANVSIIFAIAMLPLMSIVGVGVDYGRAIDYQSQIKYALDAAVLAGASTTGSSQNTVATNVFNATVSSSQLGSFSSPTFTASGSNYSGTVTGTVPTTISQLLGVSVLTVKASSEASAPLINPCIATLGEGLASSASAFTLNGAPNMNLSGCAIYSNTSMTCNGHGGSASASYAVDNVSGCSNPVPASSAMPDNYASLVSNIVMQCGTDVTGVSWGTSGVPLSPHIIVSYGSGYTQYNVCGNLNLSGTGNLVPAGQTSIIVVENGSVNVGNSSNITASSTTFILTGSSSYSHTLSFPSGAGKLATLTIEPPTGTVPWKGISIYIDPRLTTNVDDNFGPGASLVFDGIAYMPYTNLTFHGNTNSGADQCSELIVDTFTSSGSGTLSFSQSSSNCGNLGINTSASPRLVM